ncbi:MAG: glycosyltransferase [Vulcanimicrobiaceae bacterium]
MKVAFVDQRGSEPGGAELSLALLLRHLPSAIEPHAVFFEHGRFADEIKASGIATTVLTLGENSELSTRERPRLSAVAELPGRAVELARHLRSHRIDVVHTNTVKAHILGGAAARLAGKPCVAHLRDVLQGTGRAIVRSSVAFGTYYRIAIARSVADSYKLKRTLVIDNPLDLESYVHLPEREAARHALGIEDDVPLAVIVGRINRWKGQDRFLRALATVNRVTPLHGLIVGAPVFRDADFLPELHELRARLGLEHAVRFIDWVDDPRSIYAAADVHVNASTREPFGRTVIEAAACSVPSVCFDDSGVSESMGGQTGIVVPAADETALANGILRYARDPVERRAAGKAALEWSARFDASHHARRVAEVLAQARERRPWPAGAARKPSVI